MLASSKLAIDWRRSELREKKALLLSRPGPLFIDTTASAASASASVVGCDMLIMLFTRRRKTRIGKKYNLYEFRVVLNVSLPCGAC